MIIDLNDNKKELQVGCFIEFKNEQYEYFTDYEFRLKLEEIGVYLAYFLKYLATRRKPLVFF